MDPAPKDPAAITRWERGSLVVRDDCDATPAALVAADSWRVLDGRVRALDLHRRRFLDALPEAFGALDPDAFWSAAIDAIPPEGDWFPRVDARLSRGAPELLFRLRPAPEIRSTVRLATADDDPRTAPTVKGPDLEAMTRLRTAAQARGADEAVVLENGVIADGSTTCLLWWRGDAICLPSDSTARIDSVTVRSVLALAAATGVEVLPLDQAPGDLASLEVWALNALHGIRLATAWVDGPPLAAEPGRRDLWQARLDALRRPIQHSAPRRPIQHDALRRPIQHGAPRDATATPPPERPA